jgi:adenine-specific DNA-methyltransferase
MPKKRADTYSSGAKPIRQYTHADKKRVNNPPVGLVTPDTDVDLPKKAYAYDPHLDPQLTWAGKAEHTSFEVPTVSLHVHERIDPISIIDAVRRTHTGGWQPSLFESPDENPPLREAVEFYKHKHNWSNRLVAGDSLLVMNSLHEKEGLGAQVQMVYMDPPYGITYGSNFQPFVHKRDVRDGKDEDLSQEPEMIKAFRDTWELGIHSYLTYMRDRLQLARDLLHESGSIFIQISDENIHLVRLLLDEVFGKGNFASLITFQKTTGSTTRTVPRTADYLLWYARDLSKLKFRKLYQAQEAGQAGALEYKRVELKDGTLLPISKFFDGGRLSLPDGARIFATGDISSKGGDDPDIELGWEGRKYTLSCKPNRHWKTGVAGVRKLWEAGRLLRQSGLRIYKRYFDDFPYRELTHVWTDTRGEDDPSYVVQTSEKVLERCILMSTEPGDLVLDPTCGSGTTALVAERWGRRWITADTSRVAIALAKQRLMTKLHAYYELARPEEGVGSGLRCTRVQRVTQSSVAKGDPPEPVDLYDDPVLDRRRARVTGPFTVEAVPAPTVRSLADLEFGDGPPRVSDESIARSGETLRINEWRDELLKTGVRARGGQRIEFTRMEPIAGTRWLHADGETKETARRRVVVSFGPEHAPLEQRQVALALEEAQNLAPKPSLVLFASFHFDPEAAKDIEETKWPGVTLVKVQMNTDLLTDDLKKKRSSNESYWLVGQPDVRLTKLTKGDDKGKYQVAVEGFDYYDPKTGTIVSGGAERIAVWMLDTDYDGRSLFPRQVFFPMADDKHGWADLARNLRAEIDEQRIEAYRGTTSLAFEPGKYRRAAVKIVDDRGIESLKLIELP